ncbi:MAG: sulfatase [Planctomycetota bacterium]
MRSLGGALAATSLLVLASCEKPSTTARTVLFVSIDTARADYLRFDDPRTVPNLAALAERGVVFDQAVTGASWTLPSHVQMFTGQPPALHGVNFDDVQIDPNTPTLPVKFGENGWRTVGFFSGWYLVKEYGFSRGFDVYENAMPGGSAFERDLREASKIPDLRRRTDAKNAIWARADQVSHEAVTSPTIVDHAVAAIDDARDEDLFLFLHFFDPHYDYVPPDDVAKKFDPDYDGPIDGRNFYHNKAIFDGGRRVVDDRGLEHVRALYRGVIYYTDEYVGKVIDHLREVGRLDNTFVVVVGDHGEEFFEHGNRGHRNTLYDEQLRVPMLLVPPKDVEARRGRTVESQTSLSDVAPTLLDYANIPQDHCYGRSLMGAVRGEELAPLAQFSFLRPFPKVPRDDRTNVTHVFVDSWRTPTEKLLRSWVYNTRAREFVTRDAAYYDLVQDPGEHAPVSDVTDPRFVSAWNAAEALKEDLRERHDELRIAGSDTRTSSASDMLKGILEEAGYAQASEDDGPSGDGYTSSYSVPWNLAPPPRLTLADYEKELVERTTFKDE